MKEFICGKETGACATRINSIFYHNLLALSSVFLYFLEHFEKNEKKIRKSA